MLKVSESYIFSIDISEDVTVLSVAKVCAGSKLKVVNTLYGTHAELIYEKLTNTSLERRNKNDEQN